MFTTFLINLDKDTDRLRFMHDQLVRCGIDYRREQAIWGRDYKPSSEEYDEKLALKNGGHALIPGEIGCALSHARVIDKIVAEKIQYALVLEDDVLLPDNYKEIIENEIRKNEGRWEYLLFDYVAVGLPFIKQWFSGVKYSINSSWRDNKLKTLPLALFVIIKGIYIIPLSIFEGVRNWYKKRFPGPVRFFRPVYFAGAYVVSLDGAKKLNKLTRPIVFTADHLPNRARLVQKLRFRGYAPQVVFQQKRKFGSSILGVEGSKI